MRNLRSSPVAIVWLPSSPTTASCRKTTVRKYQQECYSTATNRDAMRSRPSHQPQPQSGHRETIRKMSIIRVTAQASCSSLEATWLPAVRRFSCRVEPSYCQATTRSRDWAFCAHSTTCKQAPCRVIYRMETFRSSVSVRIDSP